MSNVFRKVVHSTYDQIPIWKGQCHVKNVLKLCLTATQRYLQVFDFQEPCSSVNLVELYSIYQDIFLHEYNSHTYVWKTCIVTNKMINLARIKMLNKSHYLRQYAVHKNQILDIFKIPVSNQ